MSRLVLATREREYMFQHGKKNYIFLLYFPQHPAIQAFEFSIINIELGSI